jgi:alkylation response protein AidB-like acyl-CoA dehydrogenase
MDFELTAELKALQARALAFTEEELLSRELEVEEREALPPEVARRILGRAIADGLWPMNVPREMGGWARR